MKIRELAGSLFCYLAEIQRWKWIKGCCSIQSPDINSDISVFVGSRSHYFLVQKGCSDSCFLLFGLVVLSAAVSNWFLWPFADVHICSWQLFIFSFNLSNIFSVNSQVLSRKWWKMLIEVSQSSRRCPQMSCLSEIFTLPSQRSEEKTVLFFILKKLETGNFDFCYQRLNFAIPASLRSSPDIKHNMCRRLQRASAPGNSWRKPLNISITTTTGPSIITQRC